MAKSEILTLKQAAAALLVSENHVRGVIAAGDLPVIVLGRSVRIRARDLALFIDASTVTGKPDPKRPGVSTMARRAASPGYSDTV